MRLLTIAEAREKLERTGVTLPTLRPPSQRHLDRMTLA
jgi:hypothetical protein